MSTTLQPIRQQVARPFSISGTQFFALSNCVAQNGLFTLFVKNNFKRGYPKLGVPQNFGFASK